MHEQFTRGLGNVQVVFKEGLNGHERFAVKRLQAPLLENFLQEHLAKGGRQLINQTADTEVFVIDDVFFGFKHLADFQSNLGFLISACQIFDVINNGGNTDRNLSIEFSAQCVCNVGSDLFDLLGINTGLDVLDKHDVVLTNRDHVILGLIREHVLQHLKGHHIGLAVELDQEDDSALLGVEVQLLGLDVNIAGENVVENDVLDERALVVLFVVEALDISEEDAAGFRGAS